MSSSIQIAVTVLVAIPFALRGTVAILVIRHLLGFLMNNRPKSAQLVSVIVVTAMLSVFPALRYTGNWKDLESGRSPSAIQAYWIDKAWFGSFPFYAFSSSNRPSEASNANFQPNLRDPAYRITRVSITIDYPIVIAEVILLLVYILRIHYATINYERDRFVKKRMQMYNANSILN